jgi:hypothetical protein
MAKASRTIRTIEEIVKPRATRSNIVETGFDMHNGWLRYNGQPAYMYEGDEIVSISDPEQINGRNVYWRESLHHSFKLVRYPE